MQKRVVPLTGGDSVPNTASQRDQAVVAATFCQVIDVMRAVVRGRQHDITAEPSSVRIAPGMDEVAHHARRVRVGEDDLGRHIEDRELR